MTSATKTLTGQVTYIFAYDVAYDTAREPAGELLGQPVQRFQAAVTRGPMEQFFYSPRMVTLPPVQARLDSGPLATVRWSVKLFPVGAASIAAHVPFSVSSLDELKRYHDLVLDGKPLQQQARELAGRVTDELGEALIRPVTSIRDEEAYTVFCLDSASMGPPGEFDAAAWLADNAAAVAGLLNDDDGGKLADREVRDTLANPLTYRRNDLAVMDWDAALVVEAGDELSEMLHVMELANVQLAELEAYDRYLDDALDVSYRDLANRRVRPGRTIRNLREIRLDLSRMSDELSNTAKFFGDWHLARVYQRLFVLFHLADWHKSIDEKISTLGEMYQLLRQDQVNRVMIVLEAAIVVLFIIDLVALILGQMH